MRRKVFKFLFIISLLLSSQISSFIPLAYAASSPWTQTDWSGGSGQTSWSNITQYDSASGITTSTSGQATITATEELSNTGFETDLTGWNTTSTFNDSDFSGTSGAVAAWPLDDTTTTQSYARVVNPADSEGRDVVINGGFDADTNWVKGTGWTISGGVASISGMGNSLTQTGTLSTARTYTTTFTVSSYTSGNVRIRVCSGGTGTARNAAGTYTQTLTCSGGSTGLTFDSPSTFTGSIDNVIVKQIDIPASSSFSGTELLTDADMETSGTAQWGSSSSPTITKETTSPHGGTQVLRVARLSTNSPSATQTILTTGKRYRATGYTRSDGSATPTIGDGGTTAHWTGTTSTSWQFFDVVFVATATDLRFRTQTSTGTQYVEWDDVSVTEVSPLVGKNTLGVVPGTTANGHLTTAYTFDGSNDNVNIYSTDLNSVFTPDEGTVIAWAKVSGSGVWTDSTERIIIRLAVDSNNLVSIKKSTTSNEVAVFYVGGGTSSTVASTSLSGTTNWFQTVITWSKSGDQVKAYINGAQVGSTQTGLGTWVGNLSSTNTVIGATGSTGTNPWSGLINDVRLYNRALSDAEVAALYSNTSHNTSTTYNSTTGSAKVVAAADQTHNFTQSVNVGDTNSYNLSAYAYTNSSAVTSSDVELYVNGATISTTYTSVGGGWYQLTGTATGVASAVEYGVQVKAGKTVYLDNISLSSYTSSGTLTSSIFDSGQGSNWGTLTYSATVPSNTSVVVKARSSNSSSMSGATAFGSCSAITSGADISSNSCITDTHRYIQYELTLANTNNLVTPTFQDITIEFTVSDATAPGISLTAFTPDPTTDSTPTVSGSVTESVGTVSAVQFQVDSTSGSWSSCTADDGTFDEATETFTCTTSSLTDGSHTIFVRATDSNGNTTGSGSESSDTFTVDTTTPVSIELESPGDNAYTNNERPTFRWKATTDAVGLSKYVLEIDNPSGPNQPSGDFSIDNIEVSRTSDYETDKYVIRYENFADSDTGNNYISIYTKTSKSWGTNENDGKLREGRIIWKVKAVDNAGNETSTSRGLFLDTTTPFNLDTKLNGTSFGSTGLSTSDQTPTLTGKILDVLWGGDTTQTQTENGPRVASGPKQVVIKIEKKVGLGYFLISNYILNIDHIYYTCDNRLISDNSKNKCDKYALFTYTPQEKLDLGTYRISLTASDGANNTSLSELTVQIISPKQIAALPKADDGPAQTQEPSKAASQPVEETKEISLPILSFDTSFFEKIWENLSQLSLALIRTIVTGIFDITITSGKILVFIIEAVETGTAFSIEITTQLQTFVLNTLKNGVFSMLDIATNISTTTNKLLANMYTFIARQVPEVVGNYLLSLSNEFNACALATHRFVQHVKNHITSLTYFAIQTITTRSELTKSNFTNVTIALGQKTEDLSNQIGLAIIDVGYKFINEPTIIYDIDITILSATSAKISWKTNVVANGKVNYGLDTSYPLDIQSEQRTTDHEFVLTNLEPNTQYHFEVMSFGTNYVYDANRTFTTPE